MNSLKTRVLTKIKEIIEKYKALKKTVKNIDDYQIEKIKKQIGLMIIKMSSFGEIVKDRELKKIVREAKETLKKLIEEIRNNN